MESKQYFFIPNIQNVFLAQSIGASSAHSEGKKLKMCVVKFFSEI